MNLKSEAVESCSGDNKEWYSHFVHEPRRWTDPPEQVNQIFIKSKPMKTENNTNIGFIVMRSIQVLVLCSVVKLMGTVMSWPMPAGMTEQDWSALQGGGCVTCLCSIAALYLHNFANKRAGLTGRNGSLADHVRVSATSVALLAMLLYVFGLILLSPGEAAARGAAVSSAALLSFLYAAYCLRYCWYLSWINTYHNPLRSMFARYLTEIGLFIMAGYGIATAAQGATFSFSRVTEILF